MSHFDYTYEINFVSEEKRVRFSGNLIYRIKQKKKKRFKIRESVVVDEMTNLPYVLIYWATDEH